MSRIFINCTILFRFRSRASTDSSSMVITPSSNKESSSSTNSIVMETFQKVSGDTTSFHQRMFNTQKICQPSHTNMNHNITPNGTTNNHKSNSKGMNLRQDVDNNMTMGHHHFSLQSLLEALPAASVDTNTISEEQSSKNPSRDNEKVNKRSSLSSLSTNGSRASGDFDGFFYI